MTRVTLVTHAAFPDGVEDDHLLAAALLRAGADVRLAVWDDPAVDWSLATVTAIRSTWDYHLHPVAWFLWLATASSRTHLVNSAELVRWNSEKTYLLDLAARGIPIVPTVLLDGQADVAALCAERGWSDVVVKPAIGASAHGARRFSGSTIGMEGVAHAAALTSSGEALLQPYQRAVEAERERSLVYVDGLFCHAFSKPAFHVGLGKIDLPNHEVTSAELALGDQVLAVLPERPIFARIDLLPSTVGPVVMEAELVEPQLALGHDPATAEKLALALLRVTKRQKRGNIA